MTIAALRDDLSVSIVGLVTAITQEFDRVSMHGIRRAILAAQAEGLDLPLVEAALRPAATNADYENAWAEALAHAHVAFGGFDGIAYGDLFLRDIRAYRESQLRPLGLQPMFPLWGRPTARLAAEFVDRGFEAYLTCVDTTQLAGSFAGRRFDHTLLNDLPSAVDPCGERGEFHTCVVAGPIFQRAVSVRCGARVLRDDRFEYCDFELLRPSRSVEGAA